MLAELFNTIAGIVSPDPEDGTTVEIFVCFTVQSNIVPLILEVNGKTVVDVPEQIVCVKFTLVILGISFNVKV